MPGSIPASVAMSVGPLTSPPALIGMLLALLVVLLIGRFLIGLAWRLVVIALVVVAALWFIGLLGLPP